MELFSVETLGHGSVDVITHELTPIGEVLLGSDYDKTALTTITLSAEDFIPQVRENHNPGLFKHTLRFVRKDKYPNLRERIGKLFPYSIVYCAEYHVLEDLCVKTALAVTKLFMDNYLIVPLRLSRRGYPTLCPRGFTDKKRGVGRRTAYGISLRTIDVFVRGVPVDDCIPFAKLLEHSTTHSAMRRLLHSSFLVNNYENFERELLMESAMRILASENGTGGRKE